MNWKVKAVLYPAFSFILCFLAAVVFLGAGLVNRIGKIKKEDAAAYAAESFDIDTDKEDTIKTEDITFMASSVIQPSEDVINVLLVGRDVKEEEPEAGRTDSMIIVSLNRASKKISMVSLMRDCYVQIPGYRNNKLNAAYSIGGYALLDETIRLNFGIEIDYNIGVDFTSFIDVVNKLGGIDLELTQEEANYILMKTKQTEGLSAGMNHLSGKQALWYARTRYVATEKKEADDFGRTSRQRIVLQKIYSDVIQLPLSKITGILYEAADDIETDMEITEMVSLGTEIYGMGITSLKTHRIPENNMFTDEIISRMRVLVVDFEKAQKKLKKWLY